MLVRCTLELQPLKHGNSHAQNTVNSFFIQAALQKLAQTILDQASHAYISLFNIYIKDFYVCALMQNGIIYTFRDN